MHLFVFFPLHFFQLNSVFSAGVHARPAWCALSTQVILPAAAFRLCKQNLKAITTPSYSFHSLPQDAHPLIPTSCPLVRTCISFYLLIYDLMGTQHTRCVKEPLFLLYGAIVLQNQLNKFFFSHSSSICIHISEEDRPETHLSQISTILCLFYQKMVWLLFRTTSLCPCS